MVGKNRAVNTDQVEDAVPAGTTVAPTIASRRGVNTTARGLLFSGLAILGGGLGVSIATATDDNDANVAVSEAPATETVTVHVVTETVTETIQPSAGAQSARNGAAAQGATTDNLEPTPAPERGSAQTTDEAHTTVPSTTATTDTWATEESINKAAAAAAASPDTHGDGDVLTSGSTYQIAKGDTLANIAARAEVSTRELARHNGIVNPDIIYSGNTIVIP